MHNHKPVRAVLAMVAMVVWWALSSNGGAYAQPASPPPDSAQIVTAVQHPKTGNVVLIGSSGQLYHPLRSDVWQRKFLGGVAASVKNAIWVPEGQIFVAGTQTPLYRFDKGTWHIHPLPNRGSVVMAKAGVPVIAIGSHIYIWDTSNRWKRLTRARAPVTALWASSNTRIYVATQDGSLAKFHRRTWSSIQHPLAKDDRIDQLIGYPEKKLYALAESGSVLEIAATTANLLPRPNSLSQFVLHSAAVSSDGTLWIAGRMPDLPPDKAADAGTTQRHSPIVLVQTSKNSLKLVEPILQVPSQDQITVLSSNANKAVFMVTKQGLLRYRDTRGDWKLGTILKDVPNETKDGSFRGPAHAR